MTEGRFQYTVLFYKFIITFLAYTQYILDMLSKISTDPVDSCIGCLTFIDCELRPGIVVIKLFSCSTQQTMKFQLLIKNKMLKNKDFI